MGIFIEDAQGRGSSAGVNKNNQLEVRAEVESSQHAISQRDGQAYQVVGTATLSAATVPVLHLKNTSSTKDMVFTYIRHQIVAPTGGTAIPNVANYVTVAFNRTYASGGTLTVPVNVNRKSGNTAEATIYNNTPVLAGTAVEMDRWYTRADGDMNVWNKEGAVRLGPNDTMEISYTGDQTGGLIYARASFYMESNEV